MTSKAHNTAEGTGKAYVDPLRWKDLAKITIKLEKDQYHLSFTYGGEYIREMRFSEGGRISSYLRGRNGSLISDSTDWGDGQYHRASMEFTYWLGLLRGRSEELLELKPHARQATYTMFPLSGIPYSELDISLSVGGAKANNVKPTDFEYWDLANLLCSVKDMTQKNGQDVLML